MLSMYKSTGKWLTVVMVTAVVVTVAMVTCTDVNMRRERAALATMYHRAVSNPQSSWPYNFAQQRPRRYGSLAELAQALRNIGLSPELAHHYALIFQQRSRTVRLEQGDMISWNQVVSQKIAGDWCYSQNKQIISIDDAALRFDDIIKMFSTEGKQAHIAFWVKDEPCRATSWVKTGVEGHNLTFPSFVNFDCTVMELRQNGDHVLFVTDYIYCGETAHVVCIKY